MTDDSSKPAAHANPINWFIGIGVVVTAVSIWFTSGQPGIPLHDGDYGCSAGALAVGVAVGAGPGATVEDGKVVDVWNFDMRTGRKTSLRWRDAERMDPKKFSVTSAVPAPNGRGGTRHTRTYVCTYD